MKSHFGPKFYRLFLLAAVLKILLLDKVLAIPLPVASSDVLTIDPVDYAEGDDYAGGQFRRSNKRVASYEDTILAVDEEDDEAHSRRLRNKRSRERDAYFA